MKIIIASDIHGSVVHCKKLIEAFHQEKADTLLLLGDILDGNKEVAEILNELNERKTILCVRGNCDHTEDQAMLDFPIMAYYCLLYVKNKRILAAHGHKAIPNLSSGDIFLHGHTHVPAWNKSRYYEINPGSVSEPRQKSAHSYLLLNDDGFTWKDLDGKVFHTLEL